MNPWQSVPAFVRLAVWVWAWSVIVGVVVGVIVALYIIAHV
jgi:hypothetical protein